MQAGWLPLFPLEVVLLPRAPLPLHIFEDRYKAMIAEVMSTHSEFGVILAREKGIVNIGCTATVESVLRRYDDGRLDIMAIGRRRFEIIRLNQDKDYLRAEVQLFDDDDDTVPPQKTKSAALAACAALKEILGDTSPVPDLADPQLSFLLAQLIPDLDFRQILLRSRSESERLTLLAGNMPAYLNRLHYVMRAKKLAPNNGHAREIQTD